MSNEQKCDTNKCKKCKECECNCNLKCCDCQSEKCHCSGTNVQNETIETK